MAAEKSKTYYLDVFLHFLPIPLLFYFIAFQDSFRQQAMTFLGRSVLVLYILLFSYISIWLGILYCCGLIFYLQAIHSTPTTADRANQPTWLQYWAQIVSPVRPTTSPFVPTELPTSTHRPTLSTHNYKHVSHSAKPVSTHIPSHHPKKLDANKH